MMKQSNQYNPKEEKVMNERVVIDSFEKVDKMSDEEVFKLYKDIRHLPAEDFNKVYDISKIGAIPLYDYLIGRYNALIESKADKVPRIVMTINTVKDMDPVALLMFVWDTLHLDPFDSKYDIKPEERDEITSIMQCRLKEINEWMNKKILEDAESIIFREKEDKK